MQLLAKFNLTENPFHFRKAIGQGIETYHVHQGMEFMYVREGSGQVTVNRETFGVGPRTLLYFQPFQLHYTNFTASDPYERYVFTFDPTEADTLLRSFPALQFYLQRLSVSALNPQHLIDGNGYLGDLFDKHLARTVTAADPAMISEHTAFLICLLTHLRSHWDFTDSDMASPERSMHYIEEAVLWIERRYSDTFRLQDMADDLHLSPSYLSHLFQRVTGTNITEYVLNKRVREACKLLLITDKSVQEIGNAVGLINTSYFCKVFRKAVGLTPYQYRLSSHQRKAFSNSVQSNLPPLSSTC